MKVDNSQILRILKFESHPRVLASILFPMILVMVISMVKVVEWQLVDDFSFLGILPRSVIGLRGVLLSGFLHGDLVHLVSNAVPIAILGAAVIYFFGKHALWIISSMYISTGLIVWIVARQAYHIGASGLVYALLSFLLVGGFVRRDRPSLAIGFSVLILYGGSPGSGLIPSSPIISWESHLAGVIVGGIVAYCSRRILLFGSENHTTMELIDDTSQKNSSFSNLNHTGTSRYYKYEYKNRK